MRGRLNAPIIPWKDGFAISRQPSLGRERTRSVAVAVVAEQIIGREPELASLAAFLDTAVDASAAALLLEGEAGIGKTTLWRAAVEDARDRGYRVLACRPAESEAKLSFAALGDMVEGVLDEALPVLPEPQRQALEIALLRAEGTSAPPKQRAVSLGVLGVLRALASSAPLLLAIDDAQLRDRSSARVLEFVLRRLVQSRSRILLSARANQLAESPLGLERPFPVERLQRLEIGPLSVGALGRLLRSRLDVSFTPLLQLHRAATGNPFFALELARAVARKEGQPAPGAPLPVPANVQALLGERLARLPEGVREALALVAALDQPTPELVAAALPAPGRSDQLLGQAASAGVIEFDDGRIVFSHPLIAAAIYSQLEPPRRRRLHRRLAEIVNDPEERARHLAAATVGPNREVAAVLEEAAKRAHARGAPDAAGELCERAAELTPSALSEEVHHRRLASADFYFEAETHLVRGRSSSRSSAPSQWARREPLYFSASASSSAWQKAAMSRTRSTVRGCLRSATTTACVRLSTCSLPGTSCWSTTFQAASRKRARRSRLQRGFRTTRCSRRRWRCSATSSSTSGAASRLRSWSGHLRSSGPLRSSGSTSGRVRSSLSCSWASTSSTMLAPNWSACVTRRSSTAMRLSSRSSAISAGSSAGQETGSAPRRTPTRRSSSRSRVAAG